MTAGRILPAPEVRRIMNAIGHEKNGREKAAMKKIGRRRIPDAVADALGRHPGDETGRVPSR
jgi:hypothetical protein